MTGSFIVGIIGVVTKFYRTLGDPVILNNYVVFEF